jgi:hypothetical protein
MGQLKLFSSAKHRGITVFFCRQKCFVHQGLAQEMVKRVTTFLFIVPQVKAHWQRAGRSFTCTPLGLRTQDLF